jgi:Glycosyl transferase family 2
MKLVMTLFVRDAADVVDAHIAYHLSAGVDVIVATDAGSRDGTTEILESYERDGLVRLVRESGEVAVGEARTRMAREAATEHGADWVINSGADEFWWPRAESLKDVLAPIPPRYTVVQGLRRLFVPTRNGDTFFAERMVVRRSVAPGASPETLLRPVHRADPGVVVVDDGSVAVARNVPLRAWYPLEVLSFPDRPPGDDPGDDAKVEDTRLRDALRTLRATAQGRMFALPGEGAGLSFRTPDIVDDAAYAVECAAVGEVDLPRLEAYVAELEQRVAWLEQRLWPRVLRAAVRVGRRSARWRRRSLASRG